MFRLTKSRIFFNIISYALLSFLAVICLLPFIMLISGSFTSEQAIRFEGYSIFPREFTLEAYGMIFRYPEKIVRAYGVSTFITAVGTIGGLFFLTMTAYVISRKDFKYRNVISFYFYFTTLFNGGTVCTYIFYVSDQIYYNHDVQELLKLNSVGQERQLGEQYRDFLRLDNVLRTAELVETIYMARLFVPDSLSYSNNVRHFKPLSVLESRGDYSRLSRNGNYSFFTVPEKITMPGTTTEVEVVSLLRLVLTTDGTIRPIGVEQIGIQTYKIKSVLEKSKITKSGIVYLVNSEGKLISCSDENHSLLQELRQRSESLDFSAEAPWSEISLLGDEYYVNKTYLDMADWSLIALIPQREILQQSRQLQSIIFALTFVAIIAVFLVSNRISRYYTSRLSYLTEMMRKVPSGTLELDLETEELDEIGELFRSFSNMTRQLDLLMLDSAEG